MTRQIWVILLLLGFVGACSARNGSTIPSALSLEQTGGESQTPLPAVFPSVLVVDYAGVPSGPHKKGQPLYNAALQSGPSGLSCLIGTPTTAPSSGKVAGGGLACTTSPQIGPRGVAVDTKGNIYVADQTGATVYKIDPVKHKQTFIAGCPTSTICNYKNPYGIAVDASSPPNVYFTVNNSGTWTVLHAHGDTVNSTPSPLSSPAGGWGTLGGLAVDTSGNVYVADESHNAIWEIPPGGSPAKLPIPVCPAPTSGNGICAPYAVAVDLQGNLYVADTNDNAVKKIVIQGSVATISCVPSTVPLSQCDGYQTSTTDVPGGAGFIKPHGVAVDGAGNVYVADSNNSAIKKVSAKKGIECVVNMPKGTMVQCNGTNYAPGLAGFYLPNFVVPYPRPTPSTAARR